MMLYELASLSTGTDRKRVESRWETSSWPWKWMYHLDMYHCLDIL